MVEIIPCIKRFCMIGMWFNFDAKGVARSVGKLCIFFGNDDIRKMPGWRCFVGRNHQRKQIIVKNSWCAFYRTVVTCLSKLRLVVKGKITSFFLYVFFQKKCCISCINILSCTSSLIVESTTKSNLLNSKCRKKI